MVPTFDKFLFPVLNILNDGKEHTLKSLMENMANVFSLSDTEVLEKVSGGSETKLHNRTQRATTYLCKAGLLQRPKRGVNVITPEGKSLLATGITTITPKYLGENYPSFAIFAYGSKNTSDQENVTVDEPPKTPSELMDEAFGEINTTLASDLLDYVKNQSPKFFEQLVVKLLVSMGYGGSLDNAGVVTQFLHDDGIDGIIKEDKLVK
ncbi:MAG: restriction endonuclease [Paludibacteraceae bacterium]|nr:restriction endonuclease [Paludibacteraceae bacterium]